MPLTSVRFIVETILSDLGQIPYTFSPGVFSSVKRGYFHTSQEGTPKTQGAERRHCSFPWPGAGRPAASCGLLAPGTGAWSPQVRGAPGGTQGHLLAGALGRFPC